MIKYIKKFRPKLLHSVLLAAVSSAMALYIVISGNTAGIPEMVIYLIYVASAIGLTMAVWAIVLAFRNSNPVSHFYRLAAKTEFTDRFVQDDAFRAVITAYGTLTFNIGFAAMKAWMGIALSSTWFGVLAGYYIILCMVRFLLLKSSHTLADIHDPVKRLEREWKAYGISGGLLALASLFLQASVLHIVYTAQGYNYDGMLIYIVALYDFWCLANAVIYMVRTVKKHSPLIQSIKIISFATTLVSFLSLQTAMFASFGSDTDIAFQQVMNAITGTVICLSLAAIGVFMFIRARTRSMIQ